MPVSKYMRVRYGGKLVDENGNLILDQEFTSILSFGVPEHDLNDIVEYQDLWEPIAKRALMNEAKRHIPEKPWIEMALKSNKGVTIKITRIESLIYGTMGWSY